MPTIETVFRLISDVLYYAVDDLLGYDDDFSEAYYDCLDYYESERAPLPDDEIIDGATHHLYDIIIRQGWYDGETVRHVLTKAFSDRVHAIREQDYKMLSDEIR